VTRTLELTLQWLDNLERAIGAEALLDAMPNDFGGRLAIKDLLDQHRGRPTPGPWTVDRSQIRDADGNALASVPYTLGDEQDRANARLIASAPAMAETIAQAQRHVSAALQRLRIACDYLDENNTQAGRNFAKDARLELYLANEALGGYGHLDAAPCAAGR